MSLSKKALLALIFANIIWGAAPPIFKWSLEGIPLFTLAFLRFVIPALIIFAVTDTKKLRIKRKDYRKIFYMGYCMITINVLFLFLGLQRTVSINASAIGAAEPIFLMLGALFFLREKLKPKVLLGNVVGFAGIFLIIFQPLLQGANAGSFIGNLFLMVSVFGVIAGTILAKEVIRDYEPATLVFWSFVIGTLCVLPFFIPEVIHYGFLSHITIQGVIGILFGAFFSSLTAYYLYFWALKYFPASEVGIFTYIDPITTILIAIPLLHETLSPTFLTGSFLIIIGIYIAERKFHYHAVHLLLRKEHE